MASLLSFFWRRDRETSDEREVMGPSPEDLARWRRTHAEMEAENNALADKGFQRIDLRDSRNEIIRCDSCGALVLEIDASVHKGSHSSG